MVPHELRHHRFTSFVLEYRKICHNELACCALLVCKRRRKGFKRAATGMCDRPHGGARDRPGRAGRRPADTRGTPLLLVRWLVVSPGWGNFGELGPRAWSGTGNLEGLGLSRGVESVDRLARWSPHDVWLHHCRIHYIGLWLYACRHPLAVFSKGERVRRSLVSD